MSIALLVYVTCVALGFMTSIYLGIAMWFALRVALPLSKEYDRDGRLKTEWSGGKLVSRIKLWVYLRIFLFAAMPVLLMIFLNIQGGLCFVLGFIVPIMSQASKFDHYSRESAKEYRQKYAKYIR